MSCRNEPLLTWAGCRDKPAGRNDGSVNGESYFTCRDKHGVFVRPSQVKVLDGSRPPSAAARVSDTQVKDSRTEHVHQQPGSTSMPPPPVPTRTPARTPIPPSTPPKLTSTSSSRSISGPSPSLSGRTSAVPQASASARAQTPRTLTRTVSSASSVSVADPAQTTTTIRALSPESRSVPAPSLSAVVPTPHESTLKREVEELRIKLRILEARKVEDQERIKALETKAADGDAMRAARGKLQSMILFYAHESTLLMLCV